jgi:hypothetical protein
LERAEKSEQKLASNPLHCLLIVGIIRNGRRRNSPPTGFLVKDPMEGNSIVRVMVENVEGENKGLLVQLKADKIGDRFRLLEVAFLMMQPKGSS